MNKRSFIYAGSEIILKEVNYVRGAGEDMKLVTLIHTYDDGRECVWDDDKIDRYLSDNDDLIDWGATAQRRRQKIINKL